MNDPDFCKSFKELETNIFERFKVFEKQLGALIELQKCSSSNAFDKLFYQKLIISPLNICLDSSLYHTLMTDNDTFLPSELASLRAKLLEEKGFIIPPFEINCLESLEDNHYMIFIRNEMVHKDLVSPFSADPFPEIVNHLESILYQHADKIITRDVVWNYIKIVEENDQTLSKELMDKGLSISIIRNVFVNLIQEAVSIKDIRLIFQIILEDNHMNPDADYLSEKVRQHLSYSIINSYLTENKALEVVLLSTELENNINEAVRKKNIYQLEVLSQMIYEGLSELDESSPTLLVNPAIRLELFRNLEKFDPFIKVIATTELHEEVDIDILASIEMVKCYDLDDLEHYQEENRDLSIIKIIEEIQENEDN
jgi:flagellar biosynthesis component FlhA